MRILFDNDVPWPLRKHLTGHEVLSAYHCGWHQKKNSELLNLAEADGFDLLVTCDASMIPATSDWTKNRSLGTDANELAVGRVARW
jgi:hypothetical protein